ncbi:hypothetical protein ACGFIF_06485 [Kribbella sp. NPDC049174]|uniref:hypothetical protein n=1 Tax=Kribbella sp. NPDC049174 TaxID=3364112 RepID=UPI00371D9980
MPDELLRPTIGAGVDLKVRPWRLMSQTYVAFFGGAIASTVIAFLNARRLGVDAAGRRLILLTGAAGLVAVTIALALPFGEYDETPVPSVVVTAIAMVCSYVQQRIQRPMDRAFQLRGTDYRPLWGPGIAATVGGVAVQILIAALVDGVL